MKVLNLPKVLRPMRFCGRLLLQISRSYFCERFEVAALNTAIVPFQMDVVIGTRWFELHFDIERNLTCGTSQLKMSETGEKR
jgi:hypothetical protein